MSEKIVITCNLCDQADLVKCLRIVKDDFEFDPESDSILESCTELRNISNGSAILELNTSDTSSTISRVQLVSQGRRAEIFIGKHLEYYDTVTGNFLDSDGDEDDEGMSMYQTEVRLSSPTSRIQLKLTGLSDTCWVMGIFASVRESRQPSQSTTSHFDMTHVNQLLDSKQLSDSAVKFKSLFETFNRGGPQIDQLLLHQQIPASPSSLLSLMSTAKGDEPNNGYTKPSTSTSVNSDSKGCEKCHTLTALETKLMKRIDELERKQDEKFQQLSQLILSLQVTKT